MDKMGTQNEENKAVIDSTQYQQGNTKELPDCYEENFETVLKATTNDLENLITTAIQTMYGQHTNILSDCLISAKDTTLSQNNTCSQIKELLEKDVSSGQLEHLKSQELTMLTGELNLLDKENAKMKVELQQLRYSSQTEIESVKSVIKVLKYNISEIQSSNSAVVESLRKYGESFIGRIQAKDKQIE